MVKTYISLYKSNRFKLKLFELFLNLDLEKKCNLGTQSWQWCKHSRAVKRGNWSKSYGKKPFTNYSTSGNIEKKIHQNIWSWICITSLLAINCVNKNERLHTFQLNTTFDRNRLTDLEKKHGCQGEWWEQGIVREFGRDMYTLLYLRWLTNKDLLYSRGNSAQCYMAAWIGGGLRESGYMCVYGWVTLPCTWNYQHC